ncbi:hypothetical protein SRHO_G00255400 [Serrasalmus rhombeus]
MGYRGTVGSPALLLSHPSPPSPPAFAPILLSGQQMAGSASAVIVPCFSCSASARSPLAHRAHLLPSFLTPRCPVYRTAAATGPSVPDTHMHPLRTSRLRQQAQVSRPGTAPTSGHMLQRAAMLRAPVSESEIGQSLV